jgi:hypothetical protein
MLVQLKDKYQREISFLLFWIIANSFGLGAGVVFGEVLGRNVAQIAGQRIGHIAAIIICEGLIWLTRWAVLVHFPEFKITLVEVVVWVSTEWLGWMMGQVPAQPGYLFPYTDGVIWAQVFGVGVWILFGSIRIPRPGKKLWQIEAIGRISMGISTEIGQMVTQLTNMVVGIVTTGIILGAFLGAMTGLVIIKLALQRAAYNPNTGNPASY